MIQRSIVKKYTGGLVGKISVLVGGVLVLSGPAMGQECRPLIEQKCVSCHFITHICPDLEQKKGSWTWKRTIKSMVEHGTELTDAQAKQLVGCLSKPGEKVLDICAQK